MKTSFVFRVQGFDYNMNSEITSSSCGLEDFEYRIDFESRPGEMKEYFSELAKVFPSLMDGIKSAIQYTTQAKYPESSSAEQQPAQTEDQEVEDNADNLDPDRFKEV
jgi:hypothetical protein